MIVRHRPMVTAMRKTIMMMLAVAGLAAAGCSAKQSSAPAPAPAPTPAATVAPSELECPEVQQGRAVGSVAFDFKATAKRMTPTADGQVEMGFPSRTGGTCVVKFDHGKSTGVVFYREVRFVDVTEVS